MSGINEASLMLQGAVIQSLLNNATVTSLIGVRAYDDVPPKTPNGPTFPYVVWKVDGTNDDSSDCVIGSEIFFSIHVWSRVYGSVEARRIAGAVRQLLDEAPLSVTGYNLVTLNHRITRWVDDPDGLTKHGIVTFRALLDEVS